MKDKELDHYLREHCPEKPDGASFMLLLNSRMEQLEGIKKTLEERRKYHRTQVMIFLLISFLLGGLLMVLLLCCPFRSIGIPTFPKFPLWMIFAVSVLLITFVVQRKLT